jgi:glycosyltransferase involved in cell wall biosynthesis
VSPGPIHILTPEYPPRPGGVADHTKILAVGLREQGFQVVVWCPSNMGTKEEIDTGEVRPWLGRLRIRDLMPVGRRIFSEGGKVLLQWVPHGYGMCSINLPFCFWIWCLARRGIPIFLMAHEVFLPMEGTLKQMAAATVQRLMIRLLLCGCRCAFASTIYYCKLLQEHSPVPAPPIKHMPIYSNIPVVTDSDRVLALRKRILGTGDSPKHIIGHFSTFNGMITPLLKTCLRELFDAERDIRFVLVGKGSVGFVQEISIETPAIANCCVAMGLLTPEEVSLHLQCCDIMLQPYSGGVNTRNGSALASISHGKPLATFCGLWTEPLWREKGALIFSEGEDVNALCCQILAVLGDRERLARIGTAAQLLYSKQFAAEMSIQRFAGTLAE